MRDLDEACAIANRIAPEHLELAVADPDALLPTIRHAGAIFLGHYASEALGDYCAGPNHVLPTGRTARFSSPLGVYDFQKRSSVLRISRERRRRRWAPVAATLARGEGLTAHARSAEARIDKTRRETMAKVIAMYKTPADPAAFDRYYFATHVPIAKKIPGLAPLRSHARAVATLRRGASPYHLIATLTFDSLAAIQAALASPEGQATAADLGNFATGGVDLYIADTRTL